MELLKGLFHYLSSLESGQTNLFVAVSDVSRNIIRVGLMIHIIGLVRARTGTETGKAPG